MLEREFAGTLQSGQSEGLRGESERSDDCSAHEKNSARE